MNAPDGLPKHGDRKTFASPAGRELELVWNEDDGVWTTPVIGYHPPEREDPDHRARADEAAALVRRWPAKVFRRQTVATVWCAARRHPLIHVVRTPLGFLALPRGGRVGRQRFGGTDEDAPLWGDDPVILLDLAFHPEVPNVVHVTCKSCGRERVMYPVDLRELVFMLNNSAVRDFTAGSPILSAAP